MTRVATPIHLLIILVTILTGCSYSYAPVQVEVRDRATLEVVSGAVVRVSNTRTLNPKPPRSAGGVTDESGRVILEVALYNDLVVRVEPPDGAEHVFSSEHPAYTGAGAWIGPVRTIGGAPPTVEIRMSLTDAEAAEPSQAEPLSAPNR